MKNNRIDTIDFPIAAYNGLELMATSTPNQSVVKAPYKQMEEQVVIEIIANGKYEINVEEANANKNIKVIVKENVNCEIVEVNKTKNEQNVTKVELELEANATCYYLVIDACEETYTKRDANVLANSELKLHIVSLNKQYNESEILINLDGEYAKADYKLITVASENTHNRYDVRLNNNYPNTKANIWQKAVALNGGKTEFLATGFIKKGADNAENFQESRVLLLDDAATGDASPLLLIDHYNVLAGHGASVSRVNEEELYYLQSRGIGKREAEHLMTLAFIKPLIDEMNDEAMQEAILKKIEERLN